MIEPFLSGFLLGLSLILAIGPQNAFVLRQGLLRQHALAVVLFCALSDALLITVGIAGLSWFISDLAAQYSAQLFGLAALWLSVYGVQRLRDAWRGASGMQAAAGSNQELRATLGMAALLTFGNPHVYLDTVVLLGTLSLQYTGAAKVAFGLGAVMASLTFFSLLALGARALSPLMGTTRSWRIVDTIIAGVMFALAYGLLQSGGLVGGSDVVTEY
ncbi:MAG: LysE family transporter [Halieaceae bacterium]